MTLSPQELLASIGKDPRLAVGSPLEIGMPLELVDGLVVPNELFFVRSNRSLAVALSPEAWRLRVTGHVDREVELTLADLQALPQRSLTAFLECSGDSRGRFAPPTEGNQWGNSAVGNAVWGGVSVSAALDLAGVRPGAVDVVSQGADFPEMRRGLPIDTARNPDAMLVWRMNGEALPPPNGGPVRLLVPGWGGITSTKWAVGLEVLDRAFAGHYNTAVYVHVDESGTPVRPVREMPVKSVITSPAPGATVGAGPQTVAGYAWSGYGAVARVEVSSDGGATWDEATIALDGGRRSWVRFEHRWEATAGTIVLRSRATDDRGLTQPETAAWNAKGYQMNAIFEVPVTVG